MNDSLDQLSDLEIYVSSKDLELINLWLEDAFELCEITQKSPKGLKMNAYHKGMCAAVTVSLNSGGGGFSSIWINSKNTPWANDLEMARDAFAFFKRPIRCVESAWQEGDDPDLWFEISNEGEQTISWPN